MKIFSLIVLFGISCNLYAQQGLTIKGSVKSGSSGLALQGAMVSIKKGDKAPVRTITNKNGDYIFTGLNAGKIQLIAKYLGFKADTQYISLNKDTTLNLSLENTARELTEVKVKAPVAAVTVRNDTLSFNTQAYKTRPHAPLGELLKMLPGVKMDAGGNITMNGQKIDNITIDGKSYSVKDLSMMTRNIPADMISKVEFFDSQTEEDKQAGIKKMGQSKTMDLKLKNGKKNGFTGKAYIGGNAKGDYSAGGSVLGLDPGKLFSLMVNSNNINNQFTGPDGYVTGLSAGKQDNQSINFFSGYPISKKLTVNTNLFYNRTKTNVQNITDRQTFLADSSLLSHNAGSNISTSSSLTAFASLTYKVNQKTSISYTLSYTPVSNTQKNRDSTLLKVQKGGGQYLSSNGLTNNNSNQTTNSWSNGLALSHKFNEKGQSIEISLNHTLSRQTAETDIYTSVQTYQPPSLKIVDQRVLNPINTNDNNINVLYQEPLGKKLKLISTYQLSTSKSQQVKTSNDFDAASGLYDFPDTLNSNHFIFSTTTHQIGTTITNAGAGGKIDYSVSVAGQSYEQHNNDITTATDQRHVYYNFHPLAMLSVNLKDNRSVRFFYNGNSTNPTLDQLQPLPDLSNPYLIKSGNPALRQSYTHTLQAIYSHYNTQNGQGLQFSLNADLTQHQISSATTTLNGGVQQVQFINLDGIYHLNAGSDYSFPLLNPENGTGSISGKFNYNHDHNIINGANNIIQGKGATGDIMLNFHKGNALFIECNGAVQYLNNQYSLNQTKSNSWQQDYNVNANYNSPFGINAGIIYNLQLRNTSELPAQHAALINAYLSKDIFANKAGQVRLSGFNLLDAASDISQTIGQNYTETTQTNRLHRLILLSFIYNFEKFQKNG